MNGKSRTLIFLIVLALVSWSLPARATIFAALAKEVKKAGSVNKNVSSDYGIAKIDDATTKTEVTVGEASSLWKGYWQLNGGKLKIKRAESTSLTLTSDVTSLRFRDRWIGANEAVAKSAEHKFWLKLYREEKDKSLTKIDEVEHKVKVKKKGFGKTVTKRGYLRLAPIKAETAAVYKLEIRAKNLNTGAELSTYTFVEVQQGSSNHSQGTD